MIAPEKFIIGLVKMQSGGETVITIGISDAGNIVKAGADVVATGCLPAWMSGPLKTTTQGIAMTYRVMMDLNTYRYENYFIPESPHNYFCKNAVRCQIALLKETRQQNIILATTYEYKGLGLVKRMKEDMPYAVVNLEGGIETPEEIQRGFDAGADYVTIGKAINDPPAIIERLMDGIEIPAGREIAANNTTSAYADGIEWIDNRGEGI